MAAADEAALAALRRAVDRAVDRLNEEKEKSPCLGDQPHDLRMFGSQRRIVLDVLMACWGLGTWLGVNGLFVQLPLLVQRLPEGWKLPSAMTVAIQMGNVGMIAYVLIRKLFPRAPDTPYIYLLLGVGTLALFLNSFLHAGTVLVGGVQRSVPFLVLTFFAALVGCTSSVLFYPYLRHFRDVYLVTYLVGEGLGGFVPSVLSLVQGIGGDPECVYGPDNSTVEEVYPAPLFDTTVFLVLLGCLSAASLGSFALLDGLPAFDAERVRPAEAAKEQEAVPRGEVLLRPHWVAVLALTAVLNALTNGVLPSVQSYSCMPYGARAYHLAVTLGAMANPAACLAGVWLRPLRVRLLAALLGAALVPLAYILTTAALSPAPPLLGDGGGEALVVVSWVAAAGALSYGRMWVYGWARRGGAGGMRAVGVATQLGSAAGSLALFYVVNYTGAFVQPPRCPLPQH